MQMQFSMTMGGDSMGMPGESVETAFDMDVTVNATGDSVRITFPDFSSFEEVTGPETAA